MAVASLSNVAPPVMIWCIQVVLRDHNSIRAYLQSSWLAGWLDVNKLVQSPVTQGWCVTGAATSAALDACAGKKDCIPEVRLSARDSVEDSGYLFQEGDRDATLRCTLCSKERGKKKQLLHSFVMMGLKLGRWWQRNDGWDARWGYSIQY